MEYKYVIDYFQKLEFIVNFVWCYLPKEVVNVEHEFRKSRPDVPPVS